MNIVRFFELGIHEEHGDWGFKPMGENNADPLGGMGVAHDLTEHFHSSDFGCHDELMAFGAIYLLRWRDHTEPRRRKIVGRPESFGNFVSDELWEVLEHHVEKKLALPDPPKFRYPSGDWEWDKAKEDFGSVKQAVLDYGMFDRGADHWESSWRKYKRAASKIEGWLVQGMRRAKRRYANCVDLYSLHESVFVPVQEWADSILKIVGPDSDHGIRVFLRIEFDIRRLTWKGVAYKDWGYEEAEDGAGWYETEYTHKQRPWTKRNCIIDTGGAYE